MGVVNITPDSFSDGGLYLSADSAMAHGEQLVDEGAALLDVGGESTRPGAEPVSEAAEIEREQFLELLSGKAEGDVFGPDEPVVPQPAELPPSQERKPEREGPRPLPRPGFEPT